MAGVGVSDSFLLEQSWVPVCLGGVQLLAKSCFADTAYRLVLTDLQCVWEEEMNADAIQDRAQALNKRLRAPVSAFFSHLRSVAAPRLRGGAQEGVAEFSLLRPPGRLHVRLKSELAGVAFYWEFHCTPASVPVVCRHLVQPLLVVSRVLQRQVGELGTLLCRKDAEIQDYKENGAVLTRDRLKTEAFEEQSYRESFVTQVLPQVCVARDDLGFDAELQELYAAVTTQEGSRKRKRSDSHAPEDRPPQNQSAPEAPPPAGCPTVPGAELGAGPDQTQCSSVGPEPGPGSAEPEALQSQQAAPQNHAPSDRPATRPRKKKAMGLFR